MREFIIFIREKGVIGLAIGIIMGGAVTRLVTSIVDNLINPLIGAITGSAGELSAMAYKVPFTDIVFRWGAVVSSLIDFIAILAVVYFIFMRTPLAKIDRKKDA
ncbi:MAG: putative Large-conductance mechanosensitive channel-like protein [Candidatus Nomurabacteria bacterium]|nr:putative Large-conductance mechanosensitive channel-like protein [Candidatus Nomurabacteria bacterium]